MSSLVENTRGSNLLKFDAVCKLLVMGVAYFNRHRLMHVGEALVEDRSHR